MDEKQCVTMDQHWRLVEEDPEYSLRSRAMQREKQAWVARYGDEGLPIGIIRIPVVVHVVYKRQQENISDAQIRSQLAVLNADYRRLNGDARSTPDAFRGVAADTRIEFALATRDPNGDSTPGIVRKLTAVDVWSGNDNGMKRAGDGSPPWDVRKYLNIWVVRYRFGTCGFATGPNAPTDIQGVVCHYQAFGTFGDLYANRAYGRTATHEIGHWLNLMHIWGGSGCESSDNIDDTPIQSGSNQPISLITYQACKPFPHVSCPAQSSPHGDMFMNYMDYSPDHCANLFTADQAKEMHRTLSIDRSLILDSDALLPPDTTPRAWMKDDVDDVGEEPNASPQLEFASDDIWVRNQFDRSRHHQVAEYRPAGPPARVWVRVRNRASLDPDDFTARKATGKLVVYWAKASTGLSWPSPWDGTVTSPALMGGKIGEKTFTVRAGDVEEIDFEWRPPNPADYAGLGAQDTQFALLARIVTEEDPSPGNAAGSLSDYVRSSSRIALKNITIVESAPAEERLATFILADFKAAGAAATLSFRVPRAERPSLLDWRHVFVELPLPLAQQLAAGEPPGMSRVDDQTFEIVQPEAELGPFKLAPNERHVLKLRYGPKAQQRPFGVHVLSLDVVQMAEGRPIGGQRFVVQTPADRAGLALDRPPNVFDGVSWVPAAESGRR